MAWAAHSGSSPLTRGRRSARRIARAPTRLIPAHAGSTGTDGEAQWTSCGSSPLTRGRLLPAALATPVSGLIPAHAGSTPAAHGPGRRARAHPRSRGVDNAEREGRDEHGGSSPLTRGRPGEDRAGHARARLIPAHAGSTPNSVSGTPVRRAHPRSRGVDQLACAEPCAGWAHPRSRGVD